MDYHSWLLISQASKMNAAGVEAFASGHNELAIHHMNSALVTINKLLLMHCDQYDLATQSLPADSPFRNPRPTGSSSSPPRSQRSPRDDILVKPTLREIKFLQDDRFYIYNQALLFTAPISLRSPCDDDDDGGDQEVPCCLAVNPYWQFTSFREVRNCYIQVSFFWSVVHFNMALVLHKLIHETPEQNKKYREEAILFYKLCVQNLWVIPATSPTMNLLMLCAVNNLAHVYLNLHTCCGAVLVDSDLASDHFKRRAMPLSAHSVCPAAKPPKVAHSFLPPNFDLCNQTELIQGLLLRAIGKVIANDADLTQEQSKQVTEMSVNHIVISALSPCYVAAGA